MLLSRNAVLRHIERGNIFIHPFRLENLRTTSYDVGLGEFFFQEQALRRSSRTIFNPFNAADIKRHWGEPEKAVLAKQWMEDNGHLENIEPEDKIIILGPGETILAHTEEFIGGRNCVSTEMRAKSSMGRIGITVCKCAGWGDLGYCNRWTMEMTNHLQDSTIPLPVGMLVAQIIFYEVEPIEESYAKIGGQYQDTDNIEELMKRWTPYTMLPKFKRIKY